MISVSNNEGVIIHKFFLRWHACQHCVYWIYYIVCSYFSIRINNINWRLAIQTSFVCLIVRLCREFLQHSTIRNSIFIFELWNWRKDHLKNGVVSYDHKQISWVAGQLKQILNNLLIELVFIFFFSFLKMIHKCPFSDVKWTTSNR